MANMFNEDGTYNKTNWKAGDKITAGKLNKIEESLEAINNNDISRHVEADTRLDALEEQAAGQNEVTNERIEELNDLVLDNKDELDLAIYDINSRMTFLEEELNEGIEEVHNVAETVNGKIAAADASMKAQVNQGKADMEAMVAEVEADLEGLHAKDEELSEQLEQKASYFTLKEFKNSNNTNGEALQECINYIYQNRVVTTEMGYNGVSLGNTVIDLCGCEIVLDIPLRISNEEINYSDITFQNGVLKASDNFDGDYLTVIGKYNHTKGIRFYNITFDCNLKCSPAYIERTLNTVFNACTFTNLKTPFKMYEKQTHETIFDNCYFTNQYAVSNGYKYIECGLDLGIDSHVTNCNFIGFKNGIVCSGGANMISNNHFYGIEEYGVKTSDTNIVLNIYGNYFDSCSIYIARENGVMNISSNVFLYPQYASGIHSKYELKHTNINGNTYTYTTEKRAKLLDIPCTINGDVMTCDTDVFDKYDVGATTSRGDLVITGYIDSKNVKVAYNRNSGNIKIGEKYNYYLFPTNLASLSDNTELFLSQVGTVEEDVTNGVIANMLRTNYPMNSDVFSGVMKFTTDRIKKINYLITSCYTTSNQSNNSVFKMCDLPTHLIPPVDTFTNVLVRNPNNATDVYGSCIAMINVNGEINIYKKAGDYSYNSAEYSIKTGYSY